MEGTGKREQEWAGKAFGPPSRSNTCERRQENKEIWVESLRLQYSSEKILTSPIKSKF